MLLASTTAPTDNLPMSPDTRFLSPRRMIWGFSLIELLTVIAIVSMLAVVSGPAISSIAGARQISKGAYDVAGLLELARSTAVARQTYVWVAFQNTNTASGPEVRMAAVGSLDGSGANLDPANLFGVSRVITIRHAVMTPWGELKKATRDLAGTNTSPQSVASNTSGGSFSVGNMTFDSNNTLTFTPRGEVILKGVVSPLDGYDNLIDVSFRQARGSFVSPEADDAAVIVDGPTGAVRMLQL